MEPLLQFYAKDLQKRIPLLRKVEVIEDARDPMDMSHGRKYLMRAEVGIEFTIPYSGFSVRDQERTTEECIKTANEAAVHKVYGSILAELYEIQCRAYDNEPREIIKICEEVKKKILGYKNG